MILALLTILIMLVVAGMLTIEGLFGAACVLQHPVRRADCLQLFRADRRGRSSAPRRH